MVQYDRLMHVLIELLSDEITNTRQYASSAILTLISFADNSHRIAMYGIGRLLHFLTVSLSNDDNEEVRINIAESFFNLVRNCTDQDTMELTCLHREVLRSLADAVVQDYSADVRAYAARALEWLASDIHHGSPGYGKVLDALIKPIKWTKTACIFEALKSQALVEENRKPMVECEGILDTLAYLSSLHGVNDEEVRDCALAAIEQLTREPSMRRIMATHEGIMTELTRATFSQNGILDAYEEGDHTSRSIMKAALKNLAEEL